jgi:ketopantoate reductase
MKTNGETKIPSLLVGIGVAAIGALIAALLARKETREKVLAQGSQSLDYLKEQGQKLRERSKEAVQKGRDFMGCQCHESVQSNTEGERQAYEKARRGGMGG